MHILVALTVMLLSAACRGGNPAPAIPLDPIPLPHIPADFVSDTLVVPPELQGELAALLALPRQDWNEVDVTAFTGEQRRAAVYWRFSQPRTRGNSFWLITFATDRAGAQQFVDNLAAGWGLEIDESYFIVADQRAYYDLHREAEPRFTLGETAWLAEWLLLNYPQYVADFIPLIFYSHSEGGGGGI